MSSVPTFFAPLAGYLPFGTAAGTVEIEEQEALEKVRRQEAREAEAERIRKEKEAGFGELGGERRG